MNDLPTSREVVNEPKTGTFQIRINPEYKAELERLYSDCGMTLTEAVNVFFQMSLRVGGLPFLVNSDPKIVLNDRLADYLEEQHRIGKESADEKGWISEEEML
jgi:antitoxin component of RelBE/YafQ-DinJ toxin-antitoxin module